MEENSTEKFRINHLRRRIAEITINYEDELSAAAVREEALKQQVIEWKQHVGGLNQEIAEKDAEIERLRSEEAPLRRSRVHSILQ